MRAARDRDSRSAALCSSSRAAGVPCWAVSRCPSRCVPALASVLAPAGAVTAGGRSGRADSAAQTKSARREGILPTCRAMQAGGAKRGRSATVAHGGRITGPLDGLRRPGRKSCSLASGRGPGGPPHGLEKQRNNSSRTGTDPPVSEANKGRSGGVAAPTSRAQSRLRSSKELRPTPPGSVGHRFTLRLCLRASDQAVVSPSRSDCRVDDARRHSWISNSPGQELPPRYPRLATLGEGRRRVERTGPCWLSTEALRGSRWARDMSSL